MTLTKFKPLLSLAIMLCAAHGASAATVFDVNPGGVISANDTYFLGYEFHLSNDLMIDGLGAFDAFGNGLNAQATVQVYTAAGVLVIGATIASGTATGVASTSGGAFAFADIVQTLLTAGDYVLAATTQEAWFYQNAVYTSAVAGASVGISRWNDSNSIAFLNTTASELTYFNATLRSVDVSPVPVPASGLLLIGALGGLAALRRRAKSTW